MPNQWLCKSISLFLLASTLIALLTGAATAAAKRKRIVLVAGTPSHSTMEHEFNAGCTLLKQCLDKVPNVDAVLCLNGWPKDPHVFDGADAVLLYMDGGGGHAALQGDHLQVLSGLMNKGVGLGCAHYAVEVPADRGGKEWQEWIGGYYEDHYSCNPMWEPDYTAFPKHPITRGVKPFQVKDEWYFNMRFREDMKGIVPILVAKPSDAVRDGPYVAPRGPYPHIQANKGRDEVMLWAVERPDGGRGFGFTGGHYHLNWANENFRKIILNALLWMAHADVPKNGVESMVTPNELYAHLDDKPGRPSGPPAAR